VVIMMMIIIIIINLAMYYVGKGLARASRNELFPRRHSASEWNVFV
jgi:uncharacterized membrane protein